MIHEDVNRIVEKPYIPELNHIFHMKLETQASESWKYYLSRNQSIIVDLFQVYLLNKIKINNL